MSSDYCPVCLQQYDEGQCGCDLAKEKVDKDELNRKDSIGERRDSRDTKR